MAIRNALKSIQQDMAKQVPGVQFGFGKKEIHSQEYEPPRVTWVPRNETYTDPVRTQMRNPQPWFTSEFVFEAHCWGADFPATEKLRNECIASIWRCALSSSDVKRTEWKNPEEETDGWLCIVTFVLRAPIVDNTKSTGVATTIADDDSWASTGGTSINTGDQ